MLTVVHRLHMASALSVVWLALGRDPAYRTHRYMYHRRTQSCLREARLLFNIAVWVDLCLRNVEWADRRSPVENWAGMTLHRVRRTGVWVR